MKNNEILRGQVYWANLGKFNDSSVQSGIRPVVIISNNVGNKHSPVVSVAPLSRKYKALPVHVDLNKEDLILYENNKLEVSQVLLEHIMAIDVEMQLCGKIGELSEQKLKEVEAAIAIQLFGFDHKVYSLYKSKAI